MRFEFAPALALPKDNSPDEDVPALAGANPMDWLVVREFGLVTGQARTCDSTIGSIW
jgi:hypothetical protein